MFDQSLRGDSWRRCASSTERTPRLGTNSTEFSPSWMQRVSSFRFPPPWSQKSFSKGTTEPSCWAKSGFFCSVDWNQFNCVYCLGSRNGSEGFPFERWCLFILVLTSQVLDCSGCCLMYFCFASTRSRLSSNRANFASLIRFSSVL